MYLNRDGLPVSKVEPVAARLRYKATDNAYLFTVILLYSQSLQKNFHL